MTAAIIYTSTSRGSIPLPILCENPALERVCVPTPLATEPDLVWVEAVAQETLTPLATWHTEGPPGGYLVPVYEWRERMGACEVVDLDEPGMGRVARLAALMEKRTGETAALPLFMGAWLYVDDGVVMAERWRLEWISEEAHSVMALARTIAPEGLVLGYLVHVDAWRAREGEPVLVDVAATSRDAEAPVAPAPPTPDSAPAEDVGSRGARALADFWRARPPLSAKVLASLVLALAGALCLIGAIGWALSFGVDAGSAMIGEGALIVFGAIAVGRLSVLAYPIERSASSPWFRWGPLGIAGWPAGLALTRAATALVVGVGLLALIV